MTYKFKYQSPVQLIVNHYFDTLISTSRYSFILLTGRIYYFVVFRLCCPYHNGGRERVKECLSLKVFRTTIHVCTLFPRQFYLFTEVINPLFILLQSLQCPNVKFLCFYQFCCNYDYSVVRLMCM